jgi:phosphoribosylaminoimidazole-succinocarboxamide synthase
MKKEYSDRISVIDAVIDFQKEKGRILTNHHKINKSMFSAIKNNSILHVAPTVRAVVRRSKRGQSARSN